MRQRPIPVLLVKKTNAYRRPNVPIAMMRVQLMTMRMLQKMQRDSERSTPARLTRTLRCTKLARARQHLIGAHPIDAILGAATRSRSSLVVMRAVSRLGLKNLLIGNTAERILDELPCDMLVAKPERFKTRVPTEPRGPRQIVSALVGQLGYY